jgi:hypothetical protein
VEESSISFDGLTGSAAITSSVVSGGATENVRVVNTSGTLDRLTMSGNTFGLISTTTGNDNVDVTASVNAVVKTTLQNNTFNGTRSDFFEAASNNNATLDVGAATNDFNNGQAIIPGGGAGVSIRAGSGGFNSTAHTTFSITNNTINDGGTNAFDTVGIFVAKGQDLNGTLSGTISGNTLVAKTGSNSDGIFVRCAGSGTATVLIQNNTITNWGNAGIHLQNNDGSTTTNATVFGNSVSAPGASFPFAALFADNGGTATDTSTMNLVVGSFATAAQQNTLVGGANAVVDVSLSNFNSNTHFNLSKNGSSSATVTGVIQDDNVGSSTVDTSGGSGSINLVTTLPPTP